MSPNYCDRKVNRKTGNWNPSHAKIIDRQLKSISYFLGVDGVDKLFPVTMTFMSHYKGEQDSGFFFLYPYIRDFLVSACTLVYSFAVLTSSLLICHHIKPG